MRELIEVVVPRNSEDTRPRVKAEDVAVRLLEPVLQFLKDSGVAEASARAAFIKAWAEVAKATARKVEVASLTDPQPYMDLIANWTRHPSFLSSEGLPRDLPMKGRCGFSALVKATKSGLKPMQVLGVLREYGNVQLRPDGRVRLTKPFFHVRSDETLAFEPSVRFLLDAAGNVRGSLERGASSRRKGPTERQFWRSVDSRRVPVNKTSEFLEFVKPLSLTFLQDIDDWLAQNSVMQESRQRTVRMGLGLFTIETPSE